MPSFKTLLMMLMIASPLGLAACSDDDAGDRVGDAIEDAGDSIGDAADDAGDHLEDAGDDIEDEYDDATN